MENSGIYCIENIITNKKYIGQSKQLDERWRKHVSELNHNNHHNDYLQNAWNKYGESSFIFSVLEYCDCDKLDEREKYYIEYYETTNRDIGYNLKSGGQNGGSVLSDESRTKLSNSVRESYNVGNLIEIRRKSALNQWSNPDIKSKIMGQNNGMYGRHHSEEAKEKISQKKKGTISWRRDTRPVFCIELNRMFEDATTAGKELLIQGCAILKVCRGERKTCGGYHWKFL